MISQILVLFICDLLRSFRVTKYFLLKKSEVHYIFEETDTTFKILKKACPLVDHMKHLGI
jgi:hypothetical protein